ncbi:hypothetical protein RJT34_16233 [Clitoria ternatea]|uniref:Uncharacterized protein n=1 Tax=Clitoria ternatea TaxID=43366 RepID=A0AAN9J8T8_CLITE
MDSSGYDASQTIPYDESSQPYYAYNNYNYQYNNNQETHPPGVSAAPEPPHSAEPSHTHTQLNPVQPAPVAGSLNPAAVAVVAGALAQLVGNVDGVQREQIGPSQYRGRGRRAGRPFRGGRGRFNHRGRGRGRGVGDGRQFPSHSGPAISNAADVPASAAATSVLQPPPSVSGQSPLPTPAPVPSAPVQAPPCKLWCEICKAECNTPEMMEQHKNGKRHRKNLLVHEELQRRKAINGQQSGNISSQLNSTVQSEKVQESEEKGLPEENMGSNVQANVHNDETEIQNNVGVSEIQAEEPQEEPGDNSTVQGHGFKRKMRGGAGVKYIRSNDGSRKPVEPPKPKQFPSYICELCNVKCDSLIVYNSHLTGKKHLSNFKRVHGHLALNGEAGTRPLHPPDTNALSNSVSFPVLPGVSIQQAVSDPQVLLAQLLMNVLSKVQVPAMAPPLSGPVANQIQVLAGSSHDPLSQNLAQPQVPDSLAHFESENPPGETKIQVSYVPQQLDAIAGSSNKSNTETADGRSATEETVVKLPQDSSVTTLAEKPVTANKQVPS